MTNELDKVTEITVVIQTRQDPEFAEKEIRQAIADSGYTVADLTIEQF